MYSKPAIYLFATLLCILLNNESRATVIDSPSNLTKMPGQYANFTCTVPCTHLIDWYVEGHPYTLRGMVDDFSYETHVITSCASSDDASSEYTESLDILTTVELDQTALQCAAVAISTVGDCNVPISFSRFAVLTVEPIEEPLLPSPSPVLCPSVEQGTLTTVSISASTETVTVSATATVTSTVTATVTTTVILAVTPPPEPISAVPPLSVGISWKVLTSIVIAVTTAALFL